MRYVKRYNEDITKSYPKSEDTTILDLVENVFVYLIEDYDIQISEFATGVTLLKIQKVDYIRVSDIDEYHQSIQNQLHLVNCIGECIDKLKISVPDLVVRVENGINNIDTSKFFIYLGKSECAEVIKQMI